MPRVKSTGPKVGELKRKLRALRETECPPISKMKKEQVIREIEKLNSKHGEAHMAKSLPSKAIEDLRKVEADFSKRREEQKKSKAMEGLRQVEAPKHSVFAKVNRTPEEQKKILEDFLKHQEETKKSREEKIKAGTSETMEEFWKDEKPKRRKVRKAKEAPAPAPEPEKPKRRKVKPAEANAKRFEKGSQEAKDYMASIRAKRK